MEITFVTHKTSWAPPTGTVTYTKYTSEDSLSVKAGDEVRDVTLDNMLKRQEDAKRAAMTAANKNPRRR